MTATKKKREQITIAGARDQRRCECNKGKVCTGHDNYACGRTAGAWDFKFCTACQRHCNQPAEPR